MIHLDSESCTVIYLFSDARVETVKFVIIASLKCYFVI